LIEYFNKSIIHSLSIKLFSTLLDLHSKSIIKLMSGKRSHLILQVLQEVQTLSIEQVCTKFEISEATARREFIALEIKNLAQRFWGGIRLQTGLELTNQKPIHERQTELLEEKKAIAKAAAELVYDGDVIIIDGGTTTVQMVPFLAERRIKVITNSILIAQEFDHFRAKTGGPEITVTGGILYQELGLLTGHQSRESLMQYHASKAFISVGALNEYVATNHHHLIVETEQTMISQSEKLILLADHSKINKTHMCRICPVLEADVIISDRHESTLNFFQKPGFEAIEIILAETY